MMISLYKLQYMKKYIDKLIQNDADVLSDSPNRQPVYI